MERQKIKLRPKTEGDSTGENKPTPEDVQRPQRAFKVNPNAKRTTSGGPTTIESETAMQPKRKQKVTPSGLTRPEMVSPKETPSLELRPATEEADAKEIPSARQPDPTQQDETPKQTPPDSDPPVTQHVGAQRATHQPSWEDRFARVTWYVERNRLTSVRKASQTEGRSLSNFLNAALEEYLKRHNYK